MAKSIVLITGGMFSTRSLFDPLLMKAMKEAEELALNSQLNLWHKVHTMF